MAPRKATASSSSKPPRRSAAAKKVDSAKSNESSAAGKKRKATGPPPLPATPPPPAPTTLYVLMKTEGYAPDGFHSYQAPTNSIEGIYYSEDQAYAAAIRKIISGYESRCERPELRNIATTKGLPLKARMKKVWAEGIRLYGGEDAKFRVKKTQLFPSEIVDDDRLLDGLIPTQSPRSDDYHSDGAASSSSSDGWDDPYDRDVAL